MEQTQLRDISPDVLRFMMTWLEDDDILSACMVDRNFNQRVCNDQYWINKIKEKHGFSSDEIERLRGDNSYLSFYVMMNRFAALGRNLESATREAVRLGDTEMAKFGVRLGASRELVLIRGIRDLRDMYPDLLVRDFFRVCQARMGMGVISPAYRDLFADKIILGFPYKGQEILFVCLKDGYFPALKPNRNLPNKDIFPMIPCCFSMSAFDTFSKNIVWPYKLYNYY